MTHEFLISPYSRLALFPMIDSSGGKQESLLCKINKYKKPYAVAKCALIWGEGVSPVKAAGFVASQRKTLGQQSKPFTISNWVASAQDFHKDVSQLTKKWKMQPEVAGKASLIKKTFFSTLVFSSDSIDLVSEYPVLPFVNLSHCVNALSKTNCVIRLVLQAAVLIQGISMLKSSEQTENEEKIWHGLALLRNVLGFSILILTAATLFFCVAVSPYLLLVLSTVSLLLLLANDLHVRLKELERKGMERSQLSGVIPFSLCSL